jgi:hypothetical protein
MRWLVGRRTYMAVSYTHWQFSRVAVVSFVALGAVVIAVLAPSGMRQALAHNPVIIVIVAASLVPAVAAHVVMLSLRVNVSDQELSWHFGLGVWKKRVPRSDITGIQRTRLPWWYGIGIKYTPQGWVYLVAPGDGVEIALADGKAVFIGTDDANGLIAALAPP